MDHPKNFKNKNIERMQKMYVDIDALIEASQSPTPNYYCQFTLDKTDPHCPSFYRVNEIPFIWQYILPPIHRESPPAYVARLSITNHEDYFMQTIDFLFSRVYSKGFKIPEPPKKLEKFYKDVNGQGLDLEAFIASLVMDFILRGMVTVHLVNLKSENTVIWDYVSTKRIYNMRKDTLGRVTSFVYQTPMVDYSDRIEEKTVNYYHFFETIDGKTYLNLYDEEEFKGTKYVYDGYVQVFECYVQKRDHLSSIVPYLELARLNIQYTRTLSCYVNILSVACTPMLHVQTIDEDEIKELFKNDTLTPRGITASSVKPEYIELHGNALTHPERHLSELKGKMLSYGLSVTGQRPDRETAASVQNSLMLSISPFIGYLKTLETYLNKILELTYEKYGVKFIKEKHAIELDNAVDASVVDANQTQLLMKLLDANIVSSNDFIKLAKHTGAIPKDFEPSSVNEQTTAIAVDMQQGNMNETNNKP
jgi:hypothetical protein